MLEKVFQLFLRLFNVKNNILKSTKIEVPESCQIQDGGGRHFEIR